MELALGILTQLVRSTTSAAIEGQVIEPWQIEHFNELVQTQTIERAYRYDTDSRYP